MKKNLIVMQTGFKDCAVSCLLSIIRYYNGDISKEELSYIINTNENGTSAYHMIEGMRKIGFDGIGRKLLFKDLINSDISCPFIAHVRNLNYYHFITIYKINVSKKYFLVMDPARGKCKVSFEEFEKNYLNSILEFTCTRELKKIDKNDSLIKYIIEKMKIYKSSIIKLFLLGLLVISFSFSSSLYYKIFIDKIGNLEIKIVYFYIIVFVLINLLKNIFILYRDLFLLEVKKDIYQTITVSTIKHIFYLPYQYFKNKPTGELINRIDNLNDLNEFVVNTFISVFINLILILFCILVLLIINVKLLLITLVFSFIYFFVVYLYSKIIRSNIFDLREVNADYYNTLNESVQNYESIKNLNLLHSMLFNIEIKYKKFLRVLNKCEKKIFKEKFYRTLILDFNNLFILSFGVFLVINKILSLGDLILFIGLLPFFLDPFKDVISLITNYNYSLSSYERINDILLIRKEKFNSENKEFIKGDICFKNTSYSYDKVNNLFDNINFVIKNNSKFLIHGNSGCGKSTLMKILLKYYEGYGGDIYINNINLKDIKKEVIMNSFMYVSQHENLFSGTLKENIIMNRNVNFEEYEKVLKICGVDKIRNEKFLRDNFLIEDSGFNISGGEKQRIILARALLKKSNYLILDECLSEVDVSLEKQIIKNILDNYESKTIIYITHKEEIKSLFKESFEC
ncbi:MAG: ATP-binding cassette domain-containing protein [Bacilli bacterium]|nr:ATP-binding cassette domain-containing protein [Bacilli bacterium]